LAMARCVSSCSRSVLTVLPTPPSVHAIEKSV
jgi:hypothetical protein